MKPRLAVILPAHDEASRIAPTIERILAYSAQSLEACELIVVDDGSKDGTARLVQSRFGEAVRILRHEERRGKGAAIRTGVMAASEPWLLFVDADLSIPIEELERFLPAAEDAPIVIGSKRMPGQTISYPLHRRLGGWIGNLVIGLLVVRGFRDTQCGFKLFRADVARSVFQHQHIDGFGFDFEVLFLARRFGHAVVELPVSGVHVGKGSVSIASYLSTLAEVGAVLWNRLRGRYPRQPAPPEAGDYEIIPRARPREGRDSGRRSDSEARPPSRGSTRP